MSSFTQLEGISLVSAIIPQHRAQAVMEKIGAEFGLHTIQFDARGTIAQQRWYQRFIPMINPENEYLQYILPSKYASGFIAQIIQFADLHLPGAGAVFSTECTHYASNQDEFLCQANVSLCAQYEKIPSDDLANYNVNTNKFAIVASLQSDRTDAAIRAAMVAGSHGPIVFFSESRGIRDKIGWLKITKKPYEEVVLCIVDEMEKAAVVNALVQAGRIEMPGGGILYEQKLNYSLVNLPTSINRRNQLVNDHQIAAAIDELMGNSDWRYNNKLPNIKKASSRNNKASDTSPNVLVLLAPRKYVYDLMDKAIELGAPGANVTFVKQLGGEQDIEESGFAIHREMGLVRMVLPNELATSISIALQEQCEKENINKATFFQKPIRSVVTYGIR